MELNILYATDENYAMYTGISLYSLLENNTNIEHIKIHILDNGILNDSRLKLNILAEHLIVRLSIGMPKSCLWNLNPK